MTSTTTAEVFATHPTPRLSGELAVYWFVRDRVTSANAENDPVQFSTDDTHFERLVRAKDHRGKRVFSIDPRSVRWFFGCKELPEGNSSISFGRCVYIAWDYDPTDPVVTRLMAYELARIAQSQQAGGEVAFARRHYRKSLNELFDCANGRQSTLKRKRDAMVRVWRRWFEARSLTNRSVRRPEVTSPEPVERTVAAAT